MATNSKKHKIIKRIVPILILAGVLLPIIACAKEETDSGWFGWKKGVVWLLESIADFCGVQAGIGGKILDLSIDYSIGPKSKELFTLGMVTKGWETVRDLTNLFFIFILIFIGIATILQFSTYNYKRLLVGVILAVLFINFSMVITKVVIDSSNILAMEFVCKMTNGECKAEYISLAMANGLKFATMESWDADNGKLTEAIGENAYGKLMIAHIMRAGLYLITFFILFAGAFFFIIRTVFLIILIIFSPIALALTFIKIKTPGGAGSSAWWNHLISQSFFAPAYLFMIYLVLTFTNEVGKTFNLDEKAFANLLGGSDQVIETVPLIFNFLITGALLIGSITVARSIGGMSASYGMKAVGWTLKKGTGIQNKLLGKGLRRVAGPVAEKLATSKGRVATALRRVPLVTRGAASVAAANREKIAEIQKKYGHFSDLELKNMIPILPFGFKRAAIMQELTKRQELEPEGGLTLEQIETAKRLLGRYKLSTRPIKNLRWQYENPEDVLTNITPEYFGQILSKNKSFDFLDKLRGEKQTVAQHYINTMTEWIKDKNIVDPDEVVKALSNELTKRGNTTMGSWIYGTPARGLVTKVREAAGIEPKEKT